jgi:hypothetical protein
MFVSNGIDIISFANKKQVENMQEHSCIFINLPAG